MLRDIFTSLRFVGLTLLACSVVYPLLLFGFAQTAFPSRANGSLVRDMSGTVIGSRLIAQAFDRPEYLWPRPSAAHYDGAAAAGSNLAASNPELARKAALEVDRHGASSGDALPAELVTASGSGLDPHITLAGALHQVERIAASRGVAAARVEDVIRRVSSGGGAWVPPLVNVLAANLALDRNLGASAPVQTQR